MAAAPRNPADDQEPIPGCVPGDEVYLHHPKGPLIARIAAHGRHGITADIGGKLHKVKWDKVLGHRRRVAQELQVEDEGADGMLVRDRHGRRHYMAIPPESREEMMVAKSFGAARALFLKGMAPRPGLSEKILTDKNGVQTTRWVRQGDAPASVGQHVGFKNGDHAGHGQVMGAGRHGVTVRDPSGGMHRVEHQQVTHRWEGDGAPDHSPHGLNEKQQPAKPAWADRQEGEADKAYAKRVIDKGPEVHALPEDHGRYFKDGGDVVPLNNLHSTKSAEENQQGGDNGPKRMLAAYHGVLGKRDPITVMPHETLPGHHEVVDGNGTLTSAQKMGWSSLPVRKVSREEGLVMKMEDGINDAVKAAGMDKFFGEDEFQSLPRATSSKFKDWGSLEAAGKVAQKDFEALMAKVGEAIGAESVRFDKHDYNKPGAIFGVGPMKTLESAKRKVDDKYDGDWSRLGDLVRGSIGFDTVEEMRSGIEKLKAAGLKLATRPDNKFIKPTNAGYRDMNLSFMMPNGVIGELQLHLKPILAAKGDGHKDYEITRLLDQKAKNNPPLTEDEEQRLQEKLIAQRTLYGKAMQKALGGAGNDAKMMTKSLRQKVVLFRKAV